MLLIATLLPTVSALGYGAIALGFDSSKTHWLNPTWTLHARFLCVWRVMSYVYFDIVELFLIWTTRQHWRHLLWHHSRPFNLYIQWRSAC